MIHSHYSPIPTENTALSGTRELKIVVIGCTVPGLVVARGLQKLGCSVTVVDERPSWTYVLQQPNRGVFLLPKTQGTLQSLKAIPVDATPGPYPAFYNTSGRQGFPHLHSDKDFNGHVPNILYTSERALLKMLMESGQEEDISDARLKNPVKTSRPPLDFRFGLQLRNVNGNDRPSRISWAVPTSSGQIRTRLHLTFLAQRALKHEMKIPQTPKPCVDDETLEGGSKTCIAQADILVIADGGCSKARDVISGTSSRLTAPVFTGTVCLQGVIPSIRTGNMDTLPAFFVKKLSWMLCHPVSQDLPHDIGFTIGLCPAGAELVPEKMQKQYKLNHKSIAKQKIIELFGSGMDPIPALMESIFNESFYLNSVHYNPVYWRDFAVFALNRVALVGEAAKRTYPIYGNVIGSEIEEAAVLIDKVAELHTSLCKGQHVYIAEHLQKYNLDRQTMRGRFGELRSRRQHIVMLKYGAERRPYPFIPERALRWIYKYRVLRFLLGPGWQSSVPITAESNVTTRATVSLAREKMPVISSWMELLRRYLQRGRPVQRV